MILVIGSDNSSNSKRLVEVARAPGTPAHLIDDETEIDAGWLDGRDTIGVTSGASAPEWLVERVVECLKAHGATEVEQLHTVDEQMRFSLPAGVREPIAGLREAYSAVPEAPAAGRRISVSSSPIALLRTDRDHPVAGLELEARPRPVDPPPAPLHGQDEHPGLGLELELLERPARRPATRPRPSSRRATSSVSSSAIWMTGCSSSPCSTSHVMSRAASKIISPAYASRSSPRSSSVLRASGRRLQHPGLQLVVQDVRPRLERRHLGGQRRVLEQQRRVGQADRHLGASSSSPPGCPPHGPARRGAGSSSPGGSGRAGAPATRRMRFIPSSGPWNRSTSPSERTVSAWGSNSHWLAATDGDQPHPGLAGEQELLERPPHAGRALPDPNPRRRSRRHGGGPVGGRRGCRAWP